MVPTSPDNRGSTVLPFQNFFSWPNLNHLMTNSTINVKGQGGETDDYHSESKQIPSFIYKSELKIL